MNDYNTGGLTPEQLASLNNLISIVLLVICIIATISCWRIYKKAGKPGWTGIVPVYNCIVWQKIIGKPVWWVVFLLLPYVFVVLMMMAPANLLWSAGFLLSMIVSIVFAVWMTNLMAKSFGRSLGFTFGMIFLPFVYYPILAYSNYQYAGPAGKKELVQVS